MNNYKFELISDFNVSPLANYIKLRDVFKHTDVDVKANAFVYGEISYAFPCPNTASIIWTLPNKVSSVFANAYQYADVDHDECISEVKKFAQQISNFAKNRAFVFIPTWTLPEYYRGYGILDWRSHLGISHLISRMNIQLSESLSGQTNIYILDTQRWLLGANYGTTNKLWYAAKVPFPNEVFLKAAHDIEAGFNAILGRAKKLIIVDLDNTMWGGVIGETGWNGIRLGGHDHIGEAFKDFQSALLGLSRRGIQLAIVSKNDESVAMEAFDFHPEMQIKRSDIVGWRINWDDKATNIISLVKELNLGLSSVVFIDDNPAERDRVRMALPDVEVPEWPIDPCLYTKELLSQISFDVSNVTSEDRSRTSMYVADRGRKEILNTTNSPEEWLKQLDTTLQVSVVSSMNISRVAQLLNKTNQLNLSTRRMTEQEILQWIKPDNKEMLAFSLKDKFGDMGIVGIASIELISTVGLVTDFILSCRAMGRGVEDSMLYVIANRIFSSGGQEMRLKYLKTDRNRPTLDILKKSQLVESEVNLYICENLNEFTCPNHIVISNNNGII